MTIKLRNKTPRGWIDRPRTANLRHQHGPFLTVCVLFVSLDRVMWSPFGEVTFGHYLSSSKNLICLAWEQYKLAQIVYSMAICFLNE